MIAFVDSSVLVRAYLRDEPNHDAAYAAVFAGEQPMLASELALLECDAAFRRGVRGGRITPAIGDALCELLTADLGDDGPVTTLRSDLGRILDRAREIVRDQPVRSLDALHLAVADVDGRRVAGGTGLTFVTADRAQADAATALGLVAELIA
jgi:predicted nucleic acid-binding protein